jgi:hypothetical protein
VSAIAVSAKDRGSHYILRAQYDSDSADNQDVQSPANKQPAIPQVQVTLDGRPVELSSRQGRSLKAIRAHLEMLALQRHRVLFSLAVNGSPVNLDESMSPFKTFHKVVARTITFTQLSFQLVTVASDQVNRLHERVEKLALQVMINDWDAAEEVWWELMPDLKDPLITMSFIPPTIELLPHGEQIGGKAVKKFTQDLVTILERLEEVVVRQELLELSNALENELLPWLRGVGHCLYRFHGPEPA